MRRRAHLLCVIDAPEEDTEHRAVVPDEQEERKDEQSSDNRGIRRNGLEVDVVDDEPAGMRPQRADDDIHDRRIFGRLDECNECEPQKESL